MLEEKVNGKVYYLNERLVLTKAMKDVEQVYLSASKARSEKSEYNHWSYKDILHNWINRCPKFMDKWFRLAVVDKDAYINVKNRELYEQFIAVGQAFLEAYDLKYRYLDIKNFLDLFKEQKNLDQYSDKTFNWLFAKYGMFNIKAVDQLGASGLDNAKITVENIDKVINFYEKLDKVDFNHEKLWAEARAEAYYAFS